MSSEDEQKFGLEGNEAALGYEPMPMASPVDVPEPDTMSESELAHAQRPVEADWGHEVERQYYNNQTGEETPENQTVRPEQAAHDLENVRKAERQALEDQRNRDLAEALDQLHGQQPQQDQQHPVDAPQAEQMDPDAAQHQADAAWQEADQKITEMLADPVVRERIQGELTQIQTQANAQVEQAKQHYGAALNTLSQEINVISRALFPELANLSAEEAKGALTIMAQTNPQRVQQIVEFANRVQSVQNAVQQHAQAQQQAQAQQHQAALTEYTNDQIKRYEAWTAKENPETMRAVRENVYPIVERHYGVSPQTLREIHDGKRFVDATTFVRSAAFQAMLTDAVRYRLAQQGVTQARSNPVPRVQRPGVSSGGPTADPGEMAAAMSRFNLPGGNEGTQGIKNAAAWLTARRARG